MLMNVFDSAFLASLGLVPEASFEIIGRAPFNGPMRLRVNKEDVVLGMELTKSLWVTRTE